MPLSDTLNVLLQAAIDGFLYSSQAFYVWQNYQLFHKALSFPHL